MDALLIVGVVGLIILALKRWDQRAALPAHRQRRDAGRLPW
jgi:hypothetical protein